MYINGAEQGLDYHDADNYTLYVSPYLIVNNERFTKHYYAGTQRIASKVGSGEFYNVYGVNGFHLTAGDKDYKERLEQMEEGIKEYYKTNGIPPGEPTMKGSNADPYVVDVALLNVELGDYSVPTNWPTNVKFNDPGDVPGPVVQFEDDDQSDVKAGYGFESDNLYEGDWFFFHTDHLGSTSYLTDTAGNVSQFVCYTPYGESIVDEHLTTYENPFKFSGKELDDITGLYDHGARSRNPVSTLWYGVDPLFEKYPDFSPYNYCAGNPVKLVDEDGEGPMLALIGAGVGALIGGGIEYAKQVSHNIKTNGFDGAAFTSNIESKKVVASAVEGTITGAVAGLTDGGSLLIASASQSGACIAGGILKRCINEDKVLSMSDIVTDAASGALGGIVANCEPVRNFSKKVAQYGVSFINRVLNFAIKKTPGMIRGVFKTVTKNGGNLFNRTDNPDDSGYGYVKASEINVDGSLIDNAIIFMGSLEEVEVIGQRKK